jgi:hypothetical protein
MVAIEAARFLELEPTECGSAARRTDWIMQA